ncbi:MAG: hypothetical protein KDB80_16790, partial [Planctomycetes bacterium]|nr:hypothetical protein [Planctomycetota bacterium]
MHPLVRFLLDRLPRASDLQETAVVAPTAGAAAALRSAIVRHGRPLAGVHFVTPPALARIVCERQGFACPADRPDPLEERAVLARCIARERGPLATYARRFPAALRELGRAVREWQAAGQPDEREDEWRREFVTVARHYTDAMRGFATRTALFSSAPESLRSGTYHGPGRVLVVGRRPARDLDALLEALAAAGAAIDEFEALTDVPPPGELRSCKDPEAELRAAASDCLDATRSGVAYEDCVVAVP